MEHQEDNESLRAGPGMQVEVDLIGNDGTGELFVLDIVPDKFSDFLSGHLGENTPLAKAINGHPAGEIVPYQVDDLIAVRIIKVQAASAGPDPNVAARREETLRKAVKQSDLASAIIFATSFNSKWGDYDPSQLSEEWEGDT